MARPVRQRDPSHPYVGGTSVYPAPVLTADDIPEDIVVQWDNIQGKPTTLAGLGITDVLNVEAPLTITDGGLLADDPTISDTGGSGAMLPLANGDTPGVSLIGDPYGQPIGVPL